MEITSQKNNMTASKAREYEVSIAESRPQCRGLVWRKAVVTIVLQQWVQGIDYLAVGFTTKANHKEMQ